MTDPSLPEILIVDDDQIDQRALRRLVTSNFQSSFCDTGAEALDRVQTHAPDCVLADYRLPDYSGFEVLERLQADPSTRYIPVIITSGVGNERIAVQAIQAGASDYLPKSELTEAILRQSIWRAIRQRQTERELDEAQVALRRANAELEAFSHYIAHDLKSPLQAIQGYIELVGLQNPDLSSDSKLWMHIVDAQASRIGTLVDTLYQLAHAKWEQIHMEVLDLRALVEEVKMLFNTELDNDAATFVVEPLPLVRSNPALLRQVLQNLVGNALKYQSEAPLFVRIFATASPTHWTIHVEDHGIGIPEERLHSIFDAYERAVDADSFHGLGLGLAFCKKIIAFLQGEIYARSTLGQGTTISFTIPKATV